MPTLGWALISSGSSRRQMVAVTMLTYLYKTLTGG